MSDPILPSCLPKATYHAARKINYIIYVMLLLKTFQKFPVRLKIYLIVSPSKTQIPANSLSLSLSSPCALPHGPFCFSSESIKLVYTLNVSHAVIFAPDTCPVDFSRLLLVQLKLTSLERPSLIFVFQEVTPTNWVIVLSITLFGSVFFLRMSLFGILCVDMDYLEKAKW